MFCCLEGIFSSFKVSRVVVCVVYVVVYVVGEVVCVVGKIINVSRVVEVIIKSVLCCSGPG